MRDPEKARLRSRKYRESHPDRVKKSKAAWREKNRDDVLRKKKEYYRANADELKKKTKEYLLKNRERMRSAKRVYQRDRKSSDALFRLTENIRTTIRNSLTVRGYGKRSKCVVILGCSFDDFKTHIESQFIDGMTWENRDLWHIDHIMPISTAKSEEDVIRLNHHTNLRPLWAIDNQKKYNKIPTL